MSLVRWNPVYRPDYFGNFDSLIDSFFNRSGRYVAEQNTSLVPRINVAENDSSYEIQAELPGVDKKDIELSVKNNVLTLAGNKKSENEQKDDNHFIVERRFGSFERSFRLSGSVDSDNITAEYKNGILKVIIPKVKTQEPETAKIKIN
jgi:HSP20 family protein